VLVLLQGEKQIQSVGEKNVKEQGYICIEIEEVRRSQSE
jgi:hypothetical protein